LLKYGASYTPSLSNSLMFNYVNLDSLVRGVPHMPHGKPSTKSSLTKVVAMCHCLIGYVFHKVAFHMTLHDWFSFHENKSATCQAVLHQDNIFRVFVHVSTLRFWTILETPYSINRGVSPCIFHFEMLNVILPNLFYTISCLLVTC